MANPVKRWLETFMCKQYADTFEAYGYKTLQSLCQLQLPQLQSMGVSPEHCDKILENVSVLRQTMSGMMPYPDGSNGPVNYMHNSSSEQMSQMSYQQGQQGVPPQPNMGGMGPPMPPQGWSSQGHMPDGYHGGQGQMYQGMPQHQQTYNPYMNQGGDYQQMPPPSQSPYGNQSGYSPYYRGQPGMSNMSPGMQSPVYPGGNLPQNMQQHSPRNSQMQPQTPQQVADNILQMASSGCGNRMSPNLAHQFRAPVPMISPQMGYNQMTSPNMGQPGPYMYPNQNQMPAPNRNSPISPMQVRSPASVHSGHSMHSISPGPQQSPAASQPSPGVHSMKSPSGVPPIHQSPASTPAPPLTSPVHNMPPMATPMQGGGGSSSGGNQPSPASYTSALCSPNQQTPGHFSPNNLPINSPPSHSNSNYPMCSMPRNNHSVSSPYIDSQSTSAAQYVTTPSGSGQSLSNPLQSLQKLVMLPESQVIDPKSVVNDGSISGDGGSKNDEVGELATPASSPKTCLDGRHCGSDSENLQHDFDSVRSREEPQIVNMPSYRGTPRCLESQFSQSLDRNYEPQGFQGNVGPYEQKYDPPMLSPNYPGPPFMGSFDSHITQRSTNFPERSDDTSVENNISLPPKKKRKRAKKSECEGKGKNKVNNSQGNDSCDNAEPSNTNIADTNGGDNLDKELNQSNPNNTTNNCSNKGSNKQDTLPKTDTSSKVTDDSVSKIKNQESYNQEKVKEMEIIKNTKEREAEYDFVDDNEEVSKIHNAHNERRNITSSKENSPVYNRFSKSPSSNDKMDGTITNNKVRKRATYSRENYLGSLEDRSLMNDFDVVLDNCVTNTSFRAVNGDIISTVHTNGSLLTRVNTDVMPGSCLSQLKARKAAVRTIANGSTSPVISSSRESKLKAQLRPKRKTRVNIVTHVESDGEIYSSDPEDYMFPLVEKSAHVTVNETTKVANVTVNETTKVAKKRAKDKNSVKLVGSAASNDQDNKQNCVKPKSDQTAMEESTSILINQVTSSKCKSTKASENTDNEKSPKSDNEKPNDIAEPVQKGAESNDKTSTSAATDCVSPPKEKLCTIKKEPLSAEKNNLPNSAVPSSTEVSPEQGNKKKRGRPFGSKNKMKCSRRRKKKKVPTATLR